MSLGVLVTVRNADRIPVMKAGFHVRMPAMGNIAFNTGNGSAVCFNSTHNECKYQKH